MVMMSMTVAVAVAMFVIVRVTADLHVATTKSASTFFAHKTNSCLTTKYTKHTKP
jgi:hypothetical protein